MGLGVWLPRRGCYNIFLANQEDQISNRVLNYSEEQSRDWVTWWRRTSVMIGLGVISLEYNPKLVPFEMYRNSRISRISKISRNSRDKCSIKATWGHLKVIISVIKHSEVLSNKIRLVSNSKILYNLKITSCTHADLTARFPHKPFKPN